jgi:hypothetical protein
MWTLVLLVIYNGEVMAAKHSQYDTVFDCMAVQEKIYQTEMPDNKAGTMLVCVEGDFNEVSNSN